MVYFLFNKREGTLATYTVCVTTVLFHLIGYLYTINCDLGLAPIEVLGSFLHWILAVSRWCNKWWNKSVLFPAGLSKIGCHDMLHEQMQIYSWSINRPVTKNVVSQWNASIFILFLHSAVLKLSYCWEWHYLQLLPRDKNFVYLQRHIFGLAFITTFLMDPSR